MFDMHIIEIVTMVKRKQKWIPLCYSCLINNLKINIRKAFYLKKKCSSKEIT